MDEALKLENYSYDDYLEIDATTQERLELIFGQIYMMAGASALHQDTVGNIFFALKNIAKVQQKCTPRIAPFDVKLSVNRQINVVQPDLVLFKGSHLKAIFEILSAETAYKDLTTKKELYEASGIEEYFLVNIEYKIVDKFILQEGKYLYDKAYGIDDKLPILCMESVIELSEVFEAYNEIKTKE
ncbi:MAG: Uma2 family endonuclease [Campylobacterota bacterium]|nr:Uma2 family endonuclease [Campylobacterota bacterium]